MAALAGLACHLWNRTVEYSIQLQKERQLKHWNTHTRTYIRTYIHTYTCTYIHAYIHPSIPPIHLLLPTSSLTTVLPLANYMQYSTEGYSCNTVTRLTSPYVLVLNTILPCYIIITVINVTAIVMLLCSYATYAAKLTHTYQ